MEHGNVNHRAGQEFPLDPSSLRARVRIKNTFIEGVADEDTPKLAMMSSNSMPAPRTRALSSTSVDQSPMCDRPGGFVSAIAEEEDSEHHPVGLPMEYIDPGASLGMGPPMHSWASMSSPTASGGMDSFGLGKYWFPPPGAPAPVPAAASVAPPMRSSPSRLPAQQLQQVDVSALQGRWVHKADPHGATVGIVGGNSIQWKDGTTTHVMACGGGVFATALSGESFYGTLCDGELRWSDGDVWVPEQAPGYMMASVPAPAPARAPARGAPARAPAPAAAPPGGAPPNDAAGAGMQRQPEWSSGAESHGTGSCRPCAWFWKPQGCQHAQDCGYCHMCPEDEIKKRKKVKHAAMRESGK